MNGISFWHFGSGTELYKIMYETIWRHVEKLSKNRVERYDLGWWFHV